MPNIKNLLIVIGFGLSILLFGYHKIDTNKLEQRITKWQNKTAKYQNIVKETKTVNSKLTRKVEEIKSNNEELNNLLKKKNEKIKNQTNVVATLKDSIQNIDTKPDTIIVDGDTVKTRTFNLRKNLFHLSGYFYIVPPYTISFDTMSATIDLEINMTQNKRGVWKSYVDTKNQSVSIDSLSTDVIPYEPSFWEQLKIGVGAYATGNNAAIFTQFGYKDITAMVGYSTSGLLLGGSYWFK